MYQYTSRKQSVWPSPVVILSSFCAGRQDTSKKFAGHMNLLFSCSKNSFSWSLETAGSHTVSSLGCGSWTELRKFFFFQILVSNFAKNLVVSKFLFSWKWTSREEALASSLGTQVCKKLDIGLTFWYSSPVHPCHVVCFVQIPQACTCGWTWNLRCCRQNTYLLPPKKSNFSRKRTSSTKKVKMKKTWKATY